MPKKRPGSADLSMTRHAQPQARPAESLGLLPGHPALTEARTIFPATVISPLKSPRLFISGVNNSKLGHTVRKGPLRGFPIFQLTLEERATCPRSCAVWSECYGNSMHLARRHAHGRDLMHMIEVELELLSRDYPDGYLIRLHTLGDFYSRAYVALWSRMLDEHPALHVFGYTARTEFADGAESRAIAADLASITAAKWDRFAIRFSRAGGGAQGALVIDEDPDRPNVIVCPAQTGQTATCATCALCWSVHAQDKAIAFLRHGMRRSSGPRKPRRDAGLPPAPPVAPIRARAPESPITPALRRLAAAGDSIAVAALHRKMGMSGDD